MSFHRSVGSRLDGSDMMLMHDRWIYRAVYAHRVHVMEVLGIGSLEIWKLGNLEARKLEIKKDRRRSDPERLSQTPNHAARSAVHARILIKNINRKRKRKEYKYTYADR